MSVVRSFRDLKVYRAGFDAAMEIFHTSKRFPQVERFGLTSQIVNSSRSVCANVAEAWRKRRYPAAFVSKLNDAEAEAEETRSHLDFALGCGYLGRAEYERLDAIYDRLLGRLVRMIQQADRWAIPRPRRGRKAAAGRPVSHTPTPRKTPASKPLPEPTPTQRAGARRTAPPRAGQAPDGSRPETEPSS